MPPHKTTHLYTGGTKGNSGPDEVLHAVEDAVPVCVDGIENVLLLDADARPGLDEIRVVLDNFLEVEDDNAPQKLDSLGTDPVLGAQARDGAPHRGLLERGDVL